MFYTYTGGEKGLKVVLGVAMMDLVTGVVFESRLPLVTGVVGHRPALMSTGVSGARGAYRKEKKA